jgi:hypothetical protein
VTATIEQLVRHAQKFGIELVYETASSNGFSENELAYLRRELRHIETEQRPGCRGRRRVRR